MTPHLLAFMYYLYLLQSIEKSNKFYVGYTANLRKRLEQHNRGESFHTKKYMPWKLVYYEAYSSEELVKKREVKLKHHGKGLSELKKRAIGG